MEIIIVIGVLLLLSVLFVFVVLWWLKRKVKKITERFFTQITGYIGSTVSRLSLPEQIVEYDKILDKILSELGYTGTLAQKMQLYQEKHSLDQSVWDAHKERNKIVHELGYLPHSSDTERHVRALESQVNKILKKHS